MGRTTRIPLLCTVGRTSEDMHARTTVSRLSEWTWTQCRSEPPPPEAPDFAFINTGPTGDPIRLARPVLICMCRSVGSLDFATRRPLMARAAMPSSRPDDDDEMADVRRMNDDLEAGRVAWYGRTKGASPPPAPD